MQITVLTGYDDAFAGVGDLTTPRIAEYADTHGFYYRCQRHYHTSTHPSFQKVELALQELISLADVVIWIDADALITNNFINPLQRCKPGLNVSQDWGRQEDKEKNGIPLTHHFSMGIFVATREAVPVLKWLLYQTQWYFHPLWEQSALQEGMEKHDWIYKLVHIHPRRFMNSVDEELGHLIDSETGREYHDGNPPQEPWQVGDWLCHLTGRPNEERIKRINQFHTDVRTGLLTDR